MIYLEARADYDFLLYYYSLDQNEERFIREILKLIINYPIVWYNFLENILKNKVMINVKNGVMIVSLELLPPKQKKCFDCVYGCLKENNMIVKMIEKKGFLILYLYSQKISDFFENSGFWLEYLTAEACKEIGLTAYRGALIKTRDQNIQEIDVLIDLHTLVFFIECKDTCNYGNDDLKKMSDLRKKINVCSFALMVCSKGGLDLDYQKYEIDLIRYRHNYYIFKNELKELITKKIVGLSF